MGYRMGVSAEAAEELRMLAAIAAGLRPEWSDPERFYEVRSELAARLRRLARAAERRAA